MSLWWPGDAQRYHRRSRGHCQDPRAFRLADQSPTPCAGTRPVRSFRRPEPPETRFYPLPSCPWRVPNHRCQSAPRGGLIFFSTMLTLSGHEEYVHGVHLPCVPHQHTPQTWRHESIDCRESPPEATAVTHHITRSRKRAPNLSPLDRFLLGP